MRLGGIDLGGTKIEARLFDGPEARTIESRRIPTPRGDTDALLDALAAQVRWLVDAAGAEVPVGLCLPGVIDPETGIVDAANLPAGDRPLALALEERTGLRLPLVHDGMAFALSEARGGAGDGHRAVLGLILGTGVGGGICLDGQLPPRHAGLGLEVGHIGLPARALARHGLPLLRCGCGREGCVEAYVSGTGLAALWRLRTGGQSPAEEVAASADPAAQEVLAVWADLAGEVLAGLHLVLDPGCVVLGGGLSRMAGVELRLAEALARHRLGTAGIPAIRVARHGDSSGARGAALLALETRLKG